MRKLNWIDYTDVDTQQCLLAINVVVDERYGVTLQ